MGERLPSMCKTLGFTLNTGAGREIAILIIITITSAYLICLGPHTKKGCAPGLPTRSTVSAISQAR
jgi:hypothetical protein